MYRKRANLTKQQLAERISKTPTYIGIIEKRPDRAPTMETCQKICHALKLSEKESKELSDAALSARMKGEVIEYLKGQVNTQKVPLLDWVQINRMQEVEDPIPQGLSYETAIITTKGGTMLIALKVNTDCMQPEFVEGDVIVIDPRANPVNGNYVVVQDNESNEALFRQLRRKGSSVYLLALTPPGQIEFNPKRHKIIGKVVQKTKDY